MFVICSHYNEKYNPVKDCVESIRKFHNFDKIMVVDTGSENLDYLNLIKDYNVDIRISGPNYELGAWKECFRNCEDSEYVCIQDSVRLLKKFEFDNKKLNSYHVFNYAMQNLGFETVREYLSQIYNYYNMFPRHDIGITGSMIMINNEIKELLLKNKMFETFTPKSKIDSEISERLISCVFENLGFDVINSGVNGTDRGDGIFFNKVWLGRP